MPGACDHRVRNSSEFPVSPKERRDESRRGRHKRESALLAVSSVTNQHPKWAGEIAVNCFQIRSLARSSQRVVSGKCLRHESCLKSETKKRASPNSVYTSIFYRLVCVSCLE